MFQLLLAVLTASLLGSSHCVGMCGAFLAFAISPAGPTSKLEKFNLQLSYHLGRLCTYVVIGAVAGAIGSAVDIAGSSVGLTRVSMLLAGAMMIIFAGVAIARLLGAKIPHAPVPAPMRTVLIMAHRKIGAFGPRLRALLMGLLTTLLPCGWLYAFVIVAAGTASPLWAMLVMVVFWIGTLPLLASVGATMQWLTGNFGRWLPLATNVIVLAAGLWTLSGRALVDPKAMSMVQPSVQLDSHGSPKANTAVDCPLCHH